MRVLLIEDEALLGDAVQCHLSRAGHAVDWMRNLADASVALATTGYNVVLLDLHLPDGQGFDLLKGMRSGGDRRPVIILTARDQIGDRIRGLDLGADDYLVKPFDLNELQARLHAVSRRYQGDPNPRLKLGSVEIDLADRRVAANTRTVELTGKEWALLSCLAERPSSIRTKQDLEEAMYAFDGEVESNTVEVYVSRLRKKLGRDIITTLRGIGYRLGATAPK
jgi:two-component system, OmpR family, response regulator